MKRRHQNSMIKLKNIKINDTVAFCDIYPEDSQNKGFIKVDLKFKNIVEFVLPEGYEWCQNHLQHACIELIELSKAENNVQEKTLIWN